MTKSKCRFIHNKLPSFSQNSFNKKYLNLVIIDLIISHIGQNFHLTKDENLSENCLPCFKISKTQRSVKNVGRGVKICFSILIFSRNWRFQNSKSL